MEMAALEGKVALVSGAASGIGRQCALTLAAAGAKVAVADLNAGGGAETVALVEKQGGRALFQRLDVADEAQWQAAVDAVLARWGRFDILVNNAGMEIVALIPETSFAQWRKLMSVNLDGVFLGTRAAIAAMRKTGGGAIVNISSVAGLNGYARQAAYCASKGGVRLLTKSTAVECAEQGWNIRCNSVHPGVIDTPMARSLLQGVDPETAKHRLERLKALHPMNRLGEPADIAEAVLFLASDASKFVTGTELVVDGGMTAR
jgi:3(or 17)beta-hydroxysteroid dehydrogenase